MARDIRIVVRKGHDLQRIVPRSSPGVALVRRFSRCETIARDLMQEWPAVRLDQSKDEQCFAVDRIQFTNSIARLRLLESIKTFIVERKQLRAIQVKRLIGPAPLHHYTFRRPSGRFLGRIPASRSESQALRETFED